MDAVFNAKHVGNLVGHNVAGAPQPNLLVELLPCPLRTVPAEAEDAARAVEICQAEHKVPLVSRVQVSVGYAKNTECIWGFQRFQGRDCLPCVPLLSTVRVYAFGYFMNFKEV